jgi:PAS domain S-box-containing protein
LIAVDGVGARMLGFASSEDCLAALGSEVFASPGQGAALATLRSGAARLTVDVRGASGRARRCEFFARADERGAVVLFAPLAPIERGTERGTQSPEQTASLLDGFVGALPNPVFVKDALHRWIVLNESFCKFIGHTREEMLGRSDFEFFPRSEAEVFWEKDDHVFATGQTNENEELLTDASGKPHVILTRKSLHRDAQGRSVLLGVITEISGRKSMEEALRRSNSALDQRVAQRTVELQEANRQLAQDVAELQRAKHHLRESEAWFRHLADALPQIVWIALPTGQIEWINDRGTQYANTPMEHLLDDRWLAVVHPDDQEKTKYTWAHCLRTGEGYQIEYRLRGGDGLYRWFLARAICIRNSLGQAVRWFGTCTDMEDQKQAQKALQEEDRRKNDFLALLAHELRNPLTPVRNATYLLRRVVPGSAAFERAVAMVERQVGQMARLIDDLLDLSRITRGKILLRKERLDLIGVVRTLLGDRRESLEAHGLELEVSLPDRPLCVEADLTRTSQAIGNLLENAEKYTDRGGTVRVEVRAEGAMAAVSVKDTGIGLSPETIERIFLPFVQGPVAGRRGGLGLGLCLVKSLAELHGGSVEGHSEGLGRGSTFTLHIPLAEGAAGEAASQSPAPGGPRTPLARRRILVVEDNADAAESLRMMLELDGHEVEIAASGEEGLARARVASPDIVLSDIGLPDMSGYDLARTLRADRAVKARLVAITGYGQALDREEALDSGFERHVIKPFDHRLLERVLAELQPR